MVNVPALILLRVTAETTLLTLVKVISLQVAVEVSVSIMMRSKVEPVTPGMFNAPLVEPKVMSKTEASSTGDTERPSATLSVSTRL